MRHHQLGAARQRIEDLEELLLGDLKDSGEMRDTGWDPESLRQEHGGRQAEKAGDEEGAPRVLNGIYRHV